MKILVACEESQAVTIELRKLGHEAYSCDIEPCSGGHPEWHIQKDVLKILNGKCLFKTCDDEIHAIFTEWDMVIAFPPCTKLSNATCVNLGRRSGVCATQEWKQKFMKEREQAINFFLAFVNADCERIAIENPCGVMSTRYRKPDQYIEPYMFGDPWKKKTGLWLKNLPLLNPTEIVEPTGKWVQMNKMNRPPKSEAWEVIGHRDPKIRAKTFPGVAKAMAEQWAGQA